MFRDRRPDTYGVITTATEDLVRTRADGTLYLEHVSSLEQLETKTLCDSVEPATASSWAGPAHLAATRVGAR